MTESEARKARTALLSPAALLTKHDIAHELRITYRQVDRLLSSGKLYPADANLGGKRGRRWTRERFMAWTKAGCPRVESHYQIAV